MFELEIPKGVLIIEGITVEEFDKLKELLGDLYIYITSIAMFGKKIDFEFKEDKDASD